jgi:hypothetical protein
MAIMEHILYWDFLGDTGLSPKPWRTVSDILAKLPGVEKYQADCPARRSAPLARGCAGLSANAGRHPR